MNREALNKWIVDRMNADNLSMRDLAKNAGVDHSTISKILNGQRDAALDFYVKIARVFEAVPEMLQVAGVVAGPEIADLSLWEIVRVVKALSPEERQELERYLDYLTHRRGSAAPPLPGEIAGSG